MDYEEFVTIVVKALGEDRDTAERAIRATLSTVGERLGADESLQLVSQLPAELGPWLYTAGGPQSFDAEEFVRRVGDHEQVDPASAERHAVAVLIALARAISDDEYADLVARLSKDYAPLLPKGREVGAPSVDAFLANVAERAGVDVVRARHITEAFLETLAERIAPGDVDDLTSRLPIPLHRALKRGKANANDATRRMPADEFVRRMAQRLSFGSQQARDYARAGFAALRKAVGDEFFDVTVQLPGEYRPLLH